jgi:hypothetical protein
MTLSAFIISGVLHLVFLPELEISDSARVVLHHIFTQISDTKQHSVTLYREAPPCFDEKKKQVPSIPNKPQEFTGRTAPNESNNDPKTNFGNFCETSSIGQQDTHP